MENLAQWAATLADKRDSLAFIKVFGSIYNRLRSASLSSAGLATEAGKKLVEIGASDWYGMAKGILLTVATGTNLDALVGTVSADAFNVFVFTIDSAGAHTTTMGTEGASLASITYPPVNDDDCVIGFVIINPTGTGDFVGGTTDLDDSTVVPNAVYVNNQGAFSFTAPGV